MSENQHMQQDIQNEQQEDELKISSLSSINHAVQRHIILFKNTAGIVFFVALFFPKVQMPSILLKFMIDLLIAAVAINASFLLRESGWASIWVACLPL